MSSSKLPENLSSYPAGLPGPRWLETFLESTGDAIIGLDGDGTILSWNPGAARLFGASATEVSGHPLSTLFSEDDSGDARTLMERVRQGETLSDHPLEQPSEEGEKIALTLSLFPVKGEEGQIVGAVLVAKDATEQQRLEEELRQRTEEGLQSESQKDEFLGLLAHELRNPLAPIMSAVQVLKMRGGEDPLLMRARDVVERQARNMAQLVDDLLDVTRIFRGKISLSKGHVDLAAVIETAAQACRPAIEARQHQFTLELPDAPILLEADSHRLEQVISNLLQNAAKYTDPGGSILLQASHEDSEAVIRVQDTGVGIAPERQPHLFDLFIQGNRTGESSQEGLGIGLTLVKQIVQLHGGSVCVQSEGEGHGSAFEVRLPMGVLSAEC